MNDYFHRLTLIFVIIIAAVLGACQPAPESGNDSGLYPFSEGDSSYASLYSRASDRLAQGDYQAAEGVYARLIEMEPQNYNGYVGLGSSLLLQDRLEEAQEAYQKALEIKPDAAAALIGLGSINFREQAYEEAAEFFSRALDIESNNPNAHWGLAVSLHKLGRNTEALPHYEEVIDLIPESDLAAEAEEQIAEIGGGP